MKERSSKTQVLIPLATLAIILLVNLILNPILGTNFFEIRLDANSDGFRILSGNLVSILDYGSELAILAIGMTFVTAASGGQDISVGATIAIAASAMMRVLSGGEVIAEKMAAPVIVAFLIGCAAAVLCGAFNGTLVAFFKIPPMVATLIMYTAGRSIAAWINNNKVINIQDKAFGVYGGYIPGCPVPTPVIIAAICMLLTWLLMKFTSIGLYTQAVGINEESSRLNGINPKAIKIIAFIVLGVCVAVAALMKVSRIGTINYSVIAKDIEMDAILAVALGGNALSGGKFNMAASVIGAYAIQALTTTLYRLPFVTSAALPVYKAVVVIVLVVCSAPSVRNAFTRLKIKMAQHKNHQEVA